MSLRVALLLSFCLLAATAFAQQAAPQSTNPGASPPPTQMYVEPTLAYTPSLDVTAMDRSADPCVDFYQYSCGGWQKNNPIPRGPDLVERLRQAVRRQSEISARHSGTGRDGQRPRRRHPEDRRLLRRLHGRGDDRKPRRQAHPARAGRDPGNLKNVHELGAPGGAPASGRRDHVCSAAAPSRIRITRTR